MDNFFKDNRYKTFNIYDEDDDGKVPTKDLFVCSKTGDTKELAKLLRNLEGQAAVDERDEFGRTPLMIACMHGQGKVVEYLLRAGACPDLKDLDGYAAIHHATLASGNDFIGPNKASSCLRALAKFRAVMNRKTADGYTAIHVAIKNDCNAIVMVLRDLGCDVNKFSTDGYSPLYLACQNATRDKTVSGIISLMRLGANIDMPEPSTGKTALHKAAEEEMTEICRFLVLSKADVHIRDSNGDTALHILSRKGDLKTLEVVCQALTGGEKHGPDREKEDLEAKLEAISDALDQAKVATVLSIKNSRGDSPLHIASSYGFSDLVLFLLRQGANPAVKNNFILTQNREKMESKKRSTHKKNQKKGMQNENQEMDNDLEMIIAGGGKTPYHICAEVGHVDIFKAFVHKGVDTSDVDESGQSCLHFAAMNDDEEIASLQLLRYPQANVRTKAGWTPLHYAAVYDSVRVIVLLLDYHADPNLRNKAAQTAMDLATRDRTKRALQGLMKETLQREKNEQIKREKLLIEARKKKMQEIEKQVVQYSKQIEDNSPRSDDGDDVKPLERIRKVEKQKVQDEVESDQANGSTEKPPDSARTVSTIASLKSHPPPKEEAWERFKWEFKHNYGYRIQEKMKPIKDFLLPYWQHPAFVKQRKRAKYVLNRITKRTIPIFTGEYAPSEISSYQGTTGFTSAPPTARSNLSSFYQNSTHSSSPRQNSVTSSRDLLEQYDDLSIKSPASFIISEDPKQKEHKEPPRTIFPPIKLKLPGRWPMKQKDSVWAHHSCEFSKILLHFSFIPH
mmetsp:Transcript_8230/g.27654  ORF Transcript_8230/g.27654 Transcript_8230/m.27654 type:complete len:791 (+) Transcript_8230:298-2670(+)